MFSMFYCYFGEQLVFYRVLAVDVKLLCTGFFFPLFSLNFDYINIKIPFLVQSLKGVQVDFCLNICIIHVIRNMRKAMKGKHIKTNVPELSPEAPCLYKGYEGENTLYDVIEAGDVQSLNHLLNNKQIQSILLHHDVVDGALCSAGFAGNVQMLNRLLEVDGIRDKIPEPSIYPYRPLQGSSILRAAIEGGSLACVNRLLLLKKIQGGLGRRDLEVAIRYGHMDIFIRLLEVSVIRNRVHLRGNSALRAALFYKRASMEKVLLALDGVKSRLSEGDFEYAAKHERSLACYAIACHLWPTGRRAVPEKFKKCLPLIKEGAALVSNEKESLRLLSSVMRRNALTRVSALYQLPGMSDSPRRDGRGQVLSTSGESSGGRPLGLHGVSERAHVLIAKSLGFDGRQMMRAVYDEGVAESSDNACSMHKK